MRPAGGEHEPRFVGIVLDWRWTGFVARLALVGAYLLGGIMKLSDFQAAILEQAHFGMRPAPFWAAVVILVELIAPILILTGRLVWLGAGALGVFTVLAACTANAFWTMQGKERFAATNAFFEHLGLAGGFVLAAMVAEHDRRQRRAP